MLLDTSIWGSTVCYLTWKVKVTPGSRLLFQLVPSMPSTGEIESGLWATPTTQEVGTVCELTKTGRRKQKTGTGSRGLNLARQVMFWPTPSAQQAGEGELIKTATDKNGNAPKQGERVYNPKTGNHVQVTLNRAVKLFPTIIATDAIKGGNVSPRPGAMGLSETMGGQLNPEWVEWLMGFPIGWTDLKG
jgi:hypothetical protein